MSKDIVCVSAETAMPMSLILSSYQNVCKNLTERLKTKLTTRNPYLLIFINEAIYQVEFCNIKRGLLELHTKNLSKIVTRALRANSNQMLDTVRHLESLFQPLEHDWVTIPRDIETQCRFACDMLFLIGADMYLLGEVAMLSSTPR